MTATHPQSPASPLPEAAPTPTAEPAVSAATCTGAPCGHPREKIVYTGDGTPVYWCPDCGTNRLATAPSPVVQAPAQAGEVARLVEEAKLRADSYYSTGSFRNGESMAVVEREKLHAAVDRLAALATQPLAAPVQQGAEAEFTCATLSKAIGCKALSLMQLLQPAPTLNQRLSVNDVATIMAHLYATPTAQPVLAPVVREPLSIEQILLIADEADLARDYNDDGDVQSTRREDADITEDVVHFARAIERHFGIQATTGEQSHG